MNPTPSTAPIPKDQLLQLLVDGVIDYAIYMISPEGYVSSWNSGAQRIKGYTPDEILGQHFSRFYTPEDAAAGLPSRALAASLRDGRYENEGWRLRKNGERFWANVVIDPIYDRGRHIGFAKVTRDLSERIKAREELDASEQRFRMLVQGVTDYAIYMLSPEGIISNWNVGAERIKGYTADEVVGTHFSRFYTEEDRAIGEPQRALAIAAQHGKYEREGWRVRRDGTRFVCSVLIHPIYDDRGTLVGFAKITRDITEKKKASEQLEKAQAQLVHAQKLEALGKLTGGVAHDFNNTLQIISGNLQLLQTRIFNDIRARRYLELALEGVDRGTRLSSQLLAFARRQPLRPKATSLTRLVRGMDALLKRALGESIEINTVIPDGIWNTMIDPHQLESVILNLAINSRDAMNGEGKLTIEIDNTTVDGTWSLLGTEMKPGDYVMVAVTDTGCGMSADVRERAFEPFFTTKADGEGTGLGLSMAYGFVRQSGGDIHLYSEPGHGTTVRIYLPRTLESEPEAERPRIGPATGGNETILVVEDDLKVQATVVELLTGFGYRVLKADDPQGALSIIRSGIEIDLLFTDIVMPGSLHSTELAQQAKQVLPDLSVLFTSGYTQNAIVQGGRLKPDVELLSKPYRREELAHKIRQMLDERKRCKTLEEQSRTKPLNQNLRILVVDDNLDLRTTVCQLLEVIGHYPQAVESGEEALPMLADGSYDILFSDVTLPGMSGIELARQSRRIAPGLKIVFASGHDDLDLQSTDLPAQILKKPFTFEALQKALANLQKEPA